MVYLNLIVDIKGQSNLFSFNYDSKTIQMAREASKKEKLEKSDLVSGLGYFYESEKVDSLGRFLIMYALRTEAWKMARESDSNCINFILHDVSDGYIVRNFGITQVKSQEHSLQILTGMLQSFTNE